MAQHLFVYGSLAPDQPNHYVLAHLEGDWVSASMCGHLKNAGWGGKMGYPALVLDDDADPVAGYVLTSNQLGEAWAALDAFEGNEYHRVTARARTRGGELVEAFVYVLREVKPT